MKYYNSIGVVGHRGMVGKTTFDWFKNKAEHVDYKVIGYSLEDTASKAETLQADLLFVCVPTPFDWKTNKFDGSIVESVIKEIDENSSKENPVVVIKSTMPIGSTQKLQEKYPRLKLLFNPEFLSEKTCYADFQNPDRQFVGYTDQSYDEAIKVLNTLPESPYGAIMPVKEAELLKYINNVHGTIEIMESNMYWEVCQKEGLDYDRVLKGALASKWLGVPMGRHYRVIYHKGKRGFGGKCFPKDINAWVEYLDKNGIDSQLPTAVREMNKRILAEQNYSESDSEAL